MRDCGRSQYGHIAAPSVQGEQPRHFRQQGSSSKNRGKKSRPGAQLEILLCSALAWLHCEDGAILRFRRRDPCKPRRADRVRAAEGADCRAGGRERVLARAAGRGCNGRRRPLGKSAPGLRTYGSARHPKGTFSTVTARSGHSSAKGAPGLVNHYERTASLIGSRRSS